MYNSSNFIPYLDGLNHPASSLEEEKIINRMAINARQSVRKQKSTRRGTVFYRDINTKTKASIFHQKLLSFSKNLDVTDILEKEFEQMVIWFSDF